MIKRIIVEGADQQGKTTLVNYLSEKLKWNIIHFRKPAENFDFVSGYMIPEKTISDRNFLSEIVYSQVCERKSRASMELLSNVFRTRDTLLIVLDREDSFIFDKSRKEDYVESDIYFAIDLYKKEFKKVNMEKMILNPNCEDFEKHVQAIIDLASYEDTQETGV
jgi:thymidylate kinase